MASITKIKGRYLFGVDAATSIVPQAGAGNLVYTASASGANFTSNAVDLRGQSYFTTPFNSVPRDRTIIYVGMMPFYERVYDGDATYKWPPVVSATAPLTQNAGPVSWTSAGRLYYSGGGAIWTPGSGATDAASDTYTPYHLAFGYRDSSINYIPQIFVLGHGPDLTSGVQLGMTCGRNMAWFANTTAYTGGAVASEQTKIGPLVFPNDVTIASHCPLLGFAEYSWLTKAEAMEAVTEMVVLLEARGWTGLWHNPMTSE